MVYNGEFANINNEQYKVVIFTNITTDGLYQYQRFPNGTIPILPTQIKLSSQPFIVEYENDKNNIYKPYKCSTATLTMLMEEFNSDFYSTIKNNVLVYLLKQKASVVFNGVHYRDTVTGSILRKQLIDAGGQIFYDFIPQQIDEYCYDVEWVGFATPATYAQQYALIDEPFELQLQDALSTLKYYDYNINTTSGISTFQDTLTELMKNIGNVYKNIYITNAVRVAQSGNQNILSHLHLTHANFYDEDGEPQTALQAIEQMMLYTNLTITPYKDSLLIYNADAVAGDREYYYRISRGGNGIIYNQNTVYSTSNDMVLLGESINIDETFFASNNTSLTTTSTYRKATLTTDEYIQANLIGDIGSDDDFENINTFDVRTSVFAINDYSNNTYTQKRVYYSGRIKEPVNDKQWHIETINYQKDYKEQIEVDPMHTATRYVIPTTIVDNPTTLNDLYNKSGCTPVEICVKELQSLSDYYTPYQPSFAYLFHTKNATMTNGITPTPIALNTKYNNGNEPTIKQPMLKVKTKPIFFTSEQYLNITGAFTFYNAGWQSNNIPTPANWTVDKSTQLKKNTYLQYEWVKVKIQSGDDVKWLKNSGTSTPQTINAQYEWSDVETFCRWYYIDEIDVTPKNGFETEFAFMKNARGVDGTNILLPSMNGRTNNFGTVEMTFYRPYGCVLASSGTMYAAQTTLLTNFDMNIIDADELQYMTTINDRNNEISVDLLNNAVDDYGNIEMMLSSGKFTKHNLATVGNDYQQNTINNTATGINECAEYNNLNAVANTYIKPSIVLDVTTHLDITPITLLKWQSQFNDTTFIVDKMAIDYEYDRKQLILMSKDNNFNYQTIYNRYRKKNYKRNGDIYNGSETNSTKQLIVQPIERHAANTISNVNGAAILNVPNGTTLFENVYFEPFWHDGEIYFYVPSYMTDEITTEIINGELIINYGSL